MKFVDNVVLPQSTSLHQIECQLGQENKFVALEQSPADPSEDGHAQGVSQVEYSTIHGVRRLGLRN